MRLMVESTCGGEWCVLASCTPKLAYLAPGEPSERFSKEALLSLSAS